MCTDFSQVYCGVALWPGGVIPYEYESAVPGAETSLGTLRYNIRQTMNAWQTATGNRVTFTLSSSNPERAIIRNVGCGGMMPGWDPGLGTQDMPLGAPGCTLPHEVGHLVGMYHEQQRLDRDRYIIIDASSSLCVDSSVGISCKRTEDDGNNLGEYDLTSTEQYNADGSPPNMLRRDNGQPITTGMGLPTARDGAKAVELYSRELSSFKRAVSMGIDVGSTQPLSNALAAGVTIATGSSPAVARSASTLDLFVRGSDNRIYRRSTSAKGNPVWGSWTSISSNNAASNPGAAAVTTQGGVVVLRSDGNVYIAEQTGSWAWSSIGKPSGVTIASSPAMASNGSNQIDVLVRGTDNHLYQRRRTSGTWGSWTDRGTGTPVGTLSGTPAATYRSSSTMEVLSNTTVGNLAQATVTGSWSAWSQVTAGGLASGSSPTVTASNSSRMDVLFRSGDTRLWWKRWDATTGWASAKALGNILSSNPAAGAAGTARIDAFFVGDNGGLWYRQNRSSRVKGDFDGDGLGDFSLFRPSSTTWFVRPRSGAPDFFFVFAGVVQAGLPDDFDNDGKADPVVFEPSTSKWTVRRSTGNADLTAIWGFSTDRLQRGDFNGDGLADFTVFTPSQGNWHILPSHAFFNTPFYSTNWGVSTDITVPEDYDGDRKTDPAVYRTTEGNWYLLLSASTGVAIPYGNSSDIPLPADYDGDGKADLAFFRASDGKWHIQPSGGGSEILKTCGVAGDRFVPKDYDGDGKADPAAFHTSTGEWRVVPSGGGPDITTTFGIISDFVF